LKVTGFPFLFEALGKKKKARVDLSGNTVTDLIEVLYREYGRSEKEEKIYPKV
jgi:hypothetical protein